MSRLKELAEELTRLTDFADQDLSDWDPRTLPSMLIKQRDCVEKAKGLRVAFREEIQRTIAFILVRGPEEKVSAFGEIAEDEGSSYVFDANTPFLKIALAIEPSMDQIRRTFGLTQVAKLIGAAADLAKEVDDYNFRRPVVASQYIDSQVKSIIDLAKLVRLSVTNGTGMSLISSFIRHNVFKKAESETYSKPILPVVIYGLTEREINELLQEAPLAGSPVFVVDLETEPVSKNTLIKTYLKVKKHFNVPTTTKAEEPTSESIQQ